jgi:hypothetical protein
MLLPYRHKKQPLRAVDMMLLNWLVFYTSSLFLH